MSLVETNMRQTSPKGQSPRVELKLSREQYHAAIFDMDGVVTRTASTHAVAWKELFDLFLQRYSAEHSIPFKPFDIQTDYRLYIDGKPRLEGIRSFLKAREITIPEGTDADSSQAETVHGLGKRKNELFLQKLRSQPVEIFQSTVEAIQCLRTHGIKVAVISASRNATEVLRSAGVLDLFDAKVDGLDTERLQLKGKPAPDVFCEAARELGTDAAHSIVFEDAIAGVQAGAAGDFALVIGINRDNQADLLKSNGAHIVVSDLKELDIQLEPLPKPTPHKANPWQLIYEGYDPTQEGTRETLCTLGNGYFATRGALFSEHDDGIHYPGTYLAGVYNRLKSEVENRVVENEDLVNLPNWLPLTFRINGGPWFHIDEADILSYYQVLNLKQGVLHRKIRFRNPEGQETTLSEQRLVHMQYQHLAGLQLTITPVNWHGTLEVECLLDGRVVNNNVPSFQGLNNKHLQPLESQIREDGTLFLKMRTNQSDIRVAQAARVAICHNNRASDNVSEIIQEPDRIGKRYTLEVSPQDTIVIEKVMAFYTSRDDAISECGLEACIAIKHAPCFDKLLASQQKIWQHLWERFDVEIETTHTDEQALPSMLIRLHIFHLLQTASPNSVDLDTNIPAKGLHGEGYRGHIFWDNTFVFPFLNFRMPDITESLLKYRYRRLDKAKILALHNGFRGALYPWQSGSDGREESPALVYSSKIQQWLPDYTHLQRHVNASIVYNIWEYYQVTGDTDFLFFYGAEIVIEIARFWISACTYNPQNGRYEIRQVVGPDEYHQWYVGRETPGIDNNAYTNIMAVWCLCKALEVLDLMPDDHRKGLTDRLELSEQELQHWHDVSHKIRVDFFGKGIISQFEGYDALEEFPWVEFRKKHGSFDNLTEVAAAEGYMLDRYKIAKQADVLMLFYLFSAESLREMFGRLGYNLTSEAIPLNVDYYSRRTVHGSSLSRIANAWVLSRSHRKQSWNLFMEALQSDVITKQQNGTREGIHMGAMGGTLDLIQRCYTGLELRNEVLWFNPTLPRSLRNMKFCIHYRGNQLQVNINHALMSIQVSESRAHAIQVGFQDRVYTMHVGRTYHISL